MFLSFLDSLWFYFRRIRLYLYNHKPYSSLYFHCSTHSSKSQYYLCFFAKNTISLYNLTEVSDYNHNITSPLCPLYFVRSGNIYVTSPAYLGNVGFFGFGWPSTTSSRHYDGAAMLSSYSFAFHANYLNPSHGPGAFYGGLPLRCP